MIQGVYCYGAPDRESTYLVEAEGQAVMRDPRAAGCAVATTKLHATLAYGTSGNVAALKDWAVNVIPPLLRKHGKGDLSLRLQRWEVRRPGCAVAALTPLPGSADWRCMTELQASMLLDPRLNRAHPLYAGPDPLPMADASAGFAELWAAQQAGRDVGEVVQRAMWPHVTMLRLPGDTPAERAARFAWLEERPVDVTVRVPKLYATGWLSGHKLRFTLPVPK